MTEVVNLYKDAYDVYIGRAGHGQDGYFGNPVSLQNCSSRHECLEKFRDYFKNRIVTDPVFCSRVEMLRGKKLGCFCMPETCHGMIIVEHLEGISMDEQIRRYVDARREQVYSIFDE
jgi:hypothetical protein